MRPIGRTVRGLMGIASLALAMTFISHTAASVLATAIGATLLFLGFQSRQNFISFAGFFIIAVVVSLGNQIDTLTTVQMVLTAVLGILVPFSILLWMALSSGMDDSYLDDEVVPRMPSTRLVALYVAFVLSVPVATVLLGTLEIGISVQMSTLFELSILLVVMSLGTMILTMEGRVKGAVKED